MLAIKGGDSIIKHGMAPYRTMGDEEVQACERVLRSGVLSQFLGCDDPDFYGGPEVKAFEKEWADFFEVKHAISVNSNTSGLVCALGAIGLEPGDEVIVSPWSMCASATSILIWNALPVFADIEPETFNLDPKSVEKLIRPRTKAIVVPDIFGHAADLSALMNLAKKYGLILIEDAAQVPGARYHHQYTGTVAHIGVYSLNYHKHIHTGEGGICVTQDPVLAEKMCLIRNHAEAVVAGRQSTDLVNMIGFNFRLTELQAAIGREQLKKLPKLLRRKQEEAERLTAGLKNLDNLRLPIIKNGCTHAYYCYPLVLEGELANKREKIIEALRAEGVPGLGAGYINIHTYPMYQKRMAYGSQGYPWSVHDPDHEIQYGEGTCPVAEYLHQKTFMKFEICSYNLSDVDIDLIIKAVHKVWNGIKEL